MFELSTIFETPQALRYALRCSFRGSSSSPTLTLVKGKIRVKTRRVARAGEPLVLVCQFVLRFAGNLFEL